MGWLAKVSERWSFRRNWKDVKRPGMWWSGPEETASAKALRWTSLMCLRMRRKTTWLLHKQRGKEWHAMRLETSKPMENLSHFKYMPSGRMQLLFRGYLRQSPFFFRSHCLAWGILIPQPGIEPRSPALGVRSLNHWLTREVPSSFLKINCTI